MSDGSHVVDNEQAYSPVLVLQARYNVREAPKQAITIARYASDSTGVWHFQWHTWTSRCHFVGPDKTKS